MEKEQLLTQTMAFLLCTTPETTLGRLLGLCLASKVDAKRSGKGPLEFAEELFEHPEEIFSWIIEVVDSDDLYSLEEMVALSEMDLKDPEKFMKALLDEMTVLDTQGL
ncbi:MAG: hypothetical protein KTR27_00475 [Leptolyngbyaceae cyanobacterium MAG.088]|nr:hypothetical protein [Leptolyngbyaceae cyanobacterium MAG.088]